MQVPNANPFGSLAQIQEWDMDQPKDVGLTAVGSNTSKWKRGDPQLSWAHRQATLSPMTSVKAEGVQILEPTSI